MYALAFGNKFANATLETEVFYTSLPMTAIKDTSIKQTPMATFSSWGVVVSLIKDLLYRQDWTLSSGIGGGVAYNTTSDVKVKSSTIAKNVGRVLLEGDSTTKGILQAMVGVDYKINTGMSMGMSVKYMHLNDFVTKSNDFIDSFNGKMNLGSINLNLKYHF